MHLTLFGLIENPAAPGVLPQTGPTNPSALPNTGAPDRSPIPAWAWVAIGVTLVGGFLLSLRARRTRAR